MKYIYTGKSEKGRRENNEDNFLIFNTNEGVLVAVVADGMGGHKSGEVASILSVKYVKKIFTTLPLLGFSEEEIQKRIIMSVRSIQKKLIRLADQDERLLDMGTTLNINVFVGDKMFTLNIGDSRTSQFTKKDIVRITEDHNLATLALKSKALEKYKNYTNYLTSSLGPKKEAKADMFVTKLNKRGYMIITSDGVHNFLNSQEIIKIFKSRSKTLEAKVDSLINESYENNSNDNMTAVVVKYDS